ncbi:MAG: transglutaminase domain-containing protein [Bacteroidota bacterium]
MKKIVFYLLSIVSIAAQGQDYPKIAKELQQKYKDSEAAIIQSTITYEFVKNAKVGAKIIESKNEKLLSLRYNYLIHQTEFYDNNSIIEEFRAESSLKQKAPDGLRSCGTYTNEGDFYDDSKFCTHQLKLKEVGEVWDIGLVKIINDPKYLTSIYFQEAYPLLEKKITFIIPSDIEVEIKEMNFPDFAISKAERTEGSNKIVEYLVKALAPMERENLQRGLQYNHPHLLVLVKSAVMAGKKVNVLSSPQDLYAWYSSLTRQLQPNPQVFKSTVAQLTKDKKSDEEKIKALYYWVQDNIRYIAFEDGMAAFKPDEAQHVFEKKYGDCKGMANLTKEMLKAAGYDARLTWIGTTRIMYDHSVPSLAINNHMICTVLLGGKKYYLDATEKYIPFDENAERIQNRSVMIEDGDKFIADKIPASDKNHDIDLRNLTMKINGENLEGKYTIELKGEAKKDFLYAYHYTKNDQKEEFLTDFISKGNAHVKTSNLVLPDMEKREGTLSLECVIKYSSAVSSFNNEFYIDIDPTKIFNNWVIKDTRQSDIDFGEKIHKKTIINLQIPDGYSVSHLPAKVDISDPEFSFSINYALNGNTVVYTKELNIPQGIIKKASFSQWNMANRKLTKAYEDQILLKK